MVKDAKFWSQYLISKKTLIKFAVTPISHYWINDSRFTCKLSYAYKIGNKYKIYSPYEEVKWMSNTNSKQIQGYDQLPKQGILYYHIISQRCYVPFRDGYPRCRHAI